MIEQFTAVIVTFKSENIIYKSLSKLPKNLKIILIENSNNINFKNEIENKFENLDCILSGENIGWGRAANIGIKKVKTKYVLFLNPDLFVEENVLIKIFDKIISREDVGVIAPETIDKKGRKNIRYGFDIFSKAKLLNKKENQNELINVDTLSGHIFLTKKEILDTVGHIDENIFLNFEDRDLFKRIRKEEFKIFVYKNIYAQHLEGKSSDIKYQDQIDLCTKWHFHWSLIYYTKKHYGKIFAMLIFFKSLALNLSKLLFFIIKNDKKKLKLIFFSLKGLISSISGKASNYRPDIK
tara:strand:+ start:1126 stop:2013 length:888 start_codon:yes stop_codon:yes gene_type:complete